MTYFSDDNQDEFVFSVSDGIQTILTLLNLIPDPAIIYHNTTDKILAGNNPLYLLTNLGEKDFINQPIKSLLPDIDDTDPISGHDQETSLKHKKQPSIPVNVRIFSLSSTDDKLLLTFHPVDIHLTKSKTPSDQRTLVQQIVTLFSKNKGTEIHEIVNQLLVDIVSITDADIVSVYKASGSPPQLVPYLSTNETNQSALPVTLDIDEMNLSQDAALWTPENQATTELHKAALELKLNYLASVPLRNESANFGLLIVGGKSKNVHPSTFAVIQLIASHLSNIFDHHTEQQNSRHHLRRVRQVIRIQNEIITNLEEGVLILTPDLVIAEINPAAETMLGYSNTEALRQPVDSILIGSKSFGAALSSAQQGFPTLTGGDLMLHHRTGKSFPTQVLMVPVLENRKLLSIIALIRDTSQQEQSQADRKQLEQRAILGEVTAIFAHEVRNPINAIMLSLQVLEDNLSEGDQNIKWIENMRDECNKLMYLMDSVLSFAKPLEYRMSGIDLDYLINQILQRWHPRLSRLSIKSYYESEIENPTIEGDLRALEQVFTNLISNSVNSMSETGGSLSIKISNPNQDQSQKFLLVTLTDSGRGIPDEIKEHMFKPFVTGSQQGTGLGLAITQRIINAHKGKIEVESFPSGTIIKIYLVKRERSFQ